jgi:hypothetical protein
VPPGKARAVPTAADLLDPAREEVSAGLHRSGGRGLQRRVDASLARWAGEPRSRWPPVVEAAKLGGALLASFYRDGGLRRAGWFSGRLCGGSWRRGCRRCPLPFGRHAESGPIWVCHGPGGPVVARNGGGEEVVPRQWMSVLAVARCLGGAGRAKGSARRRLSCSSAAAETSRARSEPGRAEGLVCPCYHVQSATAYGGGGRSPPDGCSAAAPRSRPFVPSTPCRLHDGSRCTGASPRMPGRRPWKVDCTGVLTAGRRCGGDGSSLWTMWVARSGRWGLLVLAVMTPSRSCVGSSVRSVSVV